MQEDRKELLTNHQTKQKVEAAKLFIERRYTKLIQQERQKKQNWEMLVKKMKILNIPQHEQEKLKRDIIKHQTEELRKGRKRSTIKDYQLIKIIGRGAFGEVRLCKSKQTGEAVAIKKMRKSVMINKNKAIQARQQQFILTKSNNPWIVQLNEAFQDEKSLYLVMQYLPGGDLMNLLIKKDIFTDEEAKFYTAEILLALQSVHALSYIHRDLKPDNILIDKKGHIKLSDFGLCKHTEIRPSRLDEYKVADFPKRKQGFDYKRDRRKLAYSAVGTPDYVAPQVQGKTGYTQSVDWWSMGVILYEMLVGYPPFVSQQPSQTWHKISHWKQYFDIPKQANLNPHAADLIRKLVTGHKQRLGINGVEQIKAHPFFEGIDWKKIREKKAPYIPQVNSLFDTQNFDPFQQEEEWDQDGKKPGKKNRKDALFIGYTFKRAQNSQSYLLKALIDLDKRPRMISSQKSSICDSLYLQKPRQFELTDSQRKKIFRKQREEFQRVIYREQPTASMVNKLGMSHRSAKQEFKVSSRLFGVTQLIKGTATNNLNDKSKSKEAPKTNNFLIKQKQEDFKKLIGKPGLKIATGAPKKI